MLVRALGTHHITGSVGTTGQVTQPPGSSCFSARRSDTGPVVQAHAWEQASLRDRE